MQKTVLLLLLVGFAAPLSANEVTLTTYYPSPRGVYTELRAGALEAMDRTKPFAWDLNTGEIAVSGVDLIDAETGKKFRLGISGGKITITDLETEKSYLFMEVAP